MEFPIGFKFYFRNAWLTVLAHEGGSVWFTRGPTYGKHYPQRYQASVTVFETWVRAGTPFQLHNRSLRLAPLDRPDRLTAIKRLTIVEAAESTYELDQLFRFRDDPLGWWKMARHQMR